MGASGWYRFAPYQEDVEQVLQDLRQDVFEKGEYLNRWAWYKSRIDQGRESFVQQEVDRHRKAAEEALNRLEKRWEQISKTPEAGEYASAWAKHKPDIEARIQQEMSLEPKLSEEAFDDLEEWWKQAPKTQPQTIDELLAFNGLEGTHSILDIETVSPSPQEGTVSPFESETLLTLFGTEKPTREQIEAVLTEPAEPAVSMVAGHRLWNMLTTWEGRYCVVYQNDTPHELFFVAFTGD